MLLELVVSDLALFERAVLSFAPGLNVLTGETGAGKSLLLGALELLRGARPRPGWVRQGAERAVVEGRFQSPPGADGARLERWMQRRLPSFAKPGHGAQGEEDEEGDGDRGRREFVLTRTVSAEGKTRAYLDGRPVTREALAEIAARLFEVHGQNDHQRLFEPAEQLRLLDQYGDLDALVSDYREHRARWRELCERARRLETERERRRERLARAREEKAELEGARLDSQERARLQPDRDVLRHAEALRAELGAWVGELSEDDNALLDRLRRAERFAASWREQVTALGPAAEELAQAVVHVEEAARALSSLNDRLEVEPARLEAIEERLAEIERLERKYGLDLAGLVVRAGELGAELAALESDETDSGTLAEAIATARAELLQSGSTLRRARKALAAKLVRAVQKRLADLGLERARFDVRLGQRGEDGGEQGDLERFGERGLDRIEFLLAANPGEPVQRLRQCASGGEMARILLALRSVLAARGQGRTLVFDEIDAGVGGRLGPVVGRNLAGLAQHHQVLCVTHLPAIAALAERHLSVRKESAGKRTRAEVRELSGDGRVEEVADMIAGGADQETARAEARRLLEAR